MWRKKNVRKNAKFIERWEDFEKLIYKQSQDTRVKIQKINVKMHNFKNLKIWMDAIDLCEIVYGITETFPKKEQYGLISQINRCAVSIPSNIAEGSSRKSSKEFYHYLEIAIGSSFELETQIILAERVGYIKKDRAEHLNTKLTTLQKMIYSFKLKIINN